LYKARIFDAGVVVGSRMPSGLGDLCFYYSNIKLPDAPEINLQIDEDEIVIALVREGDIKWYEKVRGGYILETEWNNEILQILTIYGDVFTWDIESGQKIPASANSSILRWHHADLKNATGIDDYSAYVLKIMGALYTPKSNYDPIGDLDFDELMSH